MAKRQKKKFLALVLHQILTPLLRKIVLRDLRDFLETSRKFSVFIIGSCVTVSVRTVCKFIKLSTVGGGRESLSSYLPLWGSTSWKLRKILE